MCCANENINYYLCDKCLRACDTILVSNTFKEIKYDEPRCTSEIKKLIGST